MPTHPQDTATHNSRNDAAVPRSTLMTNHSLTGGSDDDLASPATGLSGSVKSVRPMHRIGQLGLSLLTLAVAACQSDFAPGDSRSTDEGSDRLSLAAQHLQSEHAALAEANTDLLAQQPAAGSVVPERYVVVLQPDQAAGAETLGGNRGYAQLGDQLDALRGRIAELGRSHGFGVAAILAVFPHVDAALLNISAKQADSLAQDPAVMAVDPDQVVQLAQGPVPGNSQNPAPPTSGAPTSGTQPSPTWGLDLIDQTALAANGSFRYAATGKGVTAYVIDTGIRTTHVEFGGRAVLGFSAISDGLGATDGNGHGTHVAGTIGGATFGVAKEVSLVSVRVLNSSGSGMLSGVISGADWVTAQKVARKMPFPTVANMSLGSSGVVTSLNAAIRNSIAKGVTYVVAAGNSNANACSFSPAAQAEAITVAAIGSNGARASYSNHGRCVDLFAPGSGVLSAGFTSDTATATLSGTSMAAPHAAGVVAQRLQFGSVQAKEKGLWSPDAAYVDISPRDISTWLSNFAAANQVTNPTGSVNRRLRVGSKCVITQPTCQQQPRTIGVIIDSVENADIDLGRCLRRANDYAAICTNGVTAAPTRAEFFHLDQPVANSAALGNGCLISQSRCLKQPSRAGVFSDNLNSAGSDADRCATRASDYGKLCGNPKGVPTLAQFFRNGALLRTATFSP